MRTEQEIREKLEEVKEEYTHARNLQYAGNMEALEWVLEILEHLD